MGCVAYRVGMTLRTNITLIDTLLILVGGVLAWLATASIAAGISTALLGAIAIGVWRVVRFLGQLVLLKQAEAEQDYDHQG